MQKLTRSLQRSRLSENDMLRSGRLVALEFFELVLHDEGVVSVPVCAAPGGFIARKRSTVPLLSA